MVHVHFPRNSGLFPNKLAFIVCGSQSHAKPPSWRTPHDRSTTAFIFVANLHRWSPTSARRGDTYKRLTLTIMPKILQISGK